MQVGGVQPDLVTDFVVVRLLLLFIVLILHVNGSLFKGLACFCVDLGHFFHKIASGGIGEGIVVGGVWKNSQVLSVEYGEWTFACRAVDSVVVGELRQWEPVTPVGLSIVNKDSKVFFDFLVDLFRLSIGLQMECCGRVWHDVKHSVQFFHESGDELWTSVRDDDLRRAMFRVYVVL